MFSPFIIITILSILLQYATGTYNQVVDLEDIITLNTLLGKI